MTNVVRMRDLREMERSRRHKKHGNSSQGEKFNNTPKITQQMIPFQIKNLLLSLRRKILGKIEETQSTKSLKFPFIYCSTLRRTFQFVRGLELC